MLELGPRSRSRTAEATLKVGAGEGRPQPTWSGYNLWKDIANWHANIELLAYIHYMDVRISLSIKKMSDSLTGNSATLLAYSKLGQQLGYLSIRNRWNSKFKSWRRTTTCCKSFIITISISKFRSSCNAKAMLRYVPMAATVVSTLTKKYPADCTFKTKTIWSFSSCFTSVKTLARQCTTLLSILLSPGHAL